MKTKDNMLIVVRTVATTGFAFVLSYLINLILTPYITNTVGTEAYGFVSLAKNCAQYAMIITLALNSFASRYIALEFHKGNIEKSNEYYSSVFWGNLFIGTITFGIALILILFLEHLFIIPNEIKLDVKLLFVFVFVNFWITTVFTNFSSVALIKNKLDLVGVFKTASYIVEAITLILLYFVFPEKVYYVGVGLVAASLTVSLTNLYISKKFAPELKIHFKYFRLSAVKTLVLDGLWISANSLGNVLNSGLDLVVCNLLLTPLAMGQIAIVKTLDTIFHALYQLVAQAFQPMFLKSYAENRKKQLINELLLSMKVSGLVSNIAFAGFVSLGLVYYKLWIPNEDISLIYVLTVITLGASIVSGPMTPLYYIYTLTLKKELPSIVTILGGILNVLGMYLMISYTSIGIYAVVLTTTLVMLFINLVSNPLYMSYSLGIRYSTFYPTLIKNMISCLVITAIYKLLSKVFLPASWLGLFACALLYSIIGAVVHIVILFSRSELRVLTEKVIKRR